jgi:hypothetical protein
MGVKLGGLASLDVALLKWQDNRPGRGEFSVAGGAAMRTWTGPSSRPSSRCRSNRPGASASRWRSLVVCRRRLAEYVQDGRFQFRLVPKSGIAWVVDAQEEYARMPGRRVSGGGGGHPESFSRVEMVARDDAKRYMAEHSYFSSWLR